jgi:hypothetical protein
MAVLPYRFCSRPVCIFLFINGLFNDAVSGWNYAASNGRKISERWSDRDVKGSCFDLIRSSVRHLEELKEVAQSFFPQYFLPDRGLIWVSPEYKSAVLAVESAHKFLIFQEGMLYIKMKSSMFLCWWSARNTEKLQAHYSPCPFTADRLSSPYNRPRWSRGGVEV